jgi:hypothetical protein
LGKTGKNRKNRRVNLGKRRVNLGKRRVNLGKPFAKVLIYNNLQGQKFS